MDPIDDGNGRLAVVITDGETYDKYVDLASKRNPAFEENKEEIVDKYVLLYNPEDDHDFEIMLKWNYFGSRGLDENGDPIVYPDPEPLNPEE